MKDNDKFITLESDYKIFLVNEETSDIFAGFSLASIGDSSVEMTNGLVDRFQLIKYLRPHSVSEVAQPDKDKLPPLKIVFDITEEYEKKAALSSITSNVSDGEVVTRGRLEIGNLKTSSIDIKILPGLKMAISIRMEVDSMEADPIKAFYVPNKIKDSNYQNKSLWGLEEMKEPSPAFPEPTDFY